MVNFGIMIGGAGEFRTVLEKELKNFQEGSDYYTYQENSGYSRKKHYVICSEKVAEALKKIDWRSLKDFKKIEVGEEEGSGPSEIEGMKFVVEEIVNEWLNYYETTNHNA